MISTKAAKKQITLQSANTIIQKLDAKGINVDSHTLKIPLHSQLKYHLHKGKFVLMAQDADF
jgi:hypothetical protein